MRLKEACAEFEGILVHDGVFQTLNFSTSEEDEQFLTFLENRAFISKLSKNAACVICTEDLKNEIPDTIKGIFVAKEPKVVFYKVHNQLAKTKEYRNREYKTVIGENCQISPLAFVSEKNVSIGNNVVIEEFAVIKENAVIKDYCFIGAGTIIGGKSFSYVKSTDEQMPIIGMMDIGSVVIDEGVEICSQCHIATGILKSDVTYIGRYAKLDAMVHVGHGTKIGTRTLIPAGAQLSGNVEIGKDVWIGVNATVANRLKIGDNSRVTLGSVVTQNVEEEKTVTGNFAVEHRQFIDYLKWMRSKDFKEENSIVHDMLEKEVKELNIGDNIDADGRGDAMMEEKMEENKGLQEKIRGEGYYEEEINNYNVHESSYVDEEVQVGNGTHIWHFCHIQKGAVIGDNCSFGQNVNIASRVRIGNGCKVQNNVNICEGVEFGDYVFCGPAVVFTNDRTPRAKYPKGRASYKKTLIKTGATIGGNVTLVCGNTIGKWAMIAAGAVVTKDVRDYALMAGVPAKQIGWVCECGAVLEKNLKCPSCNREYTMSVNDRLVEKE